MDSSDDAVPAPASPVQGKRKPLKPAIGAAILRTQSEVSTLPKTERNNYGKYDFVSIDTYYEEIVPLANKNGLFWYIHLPEMTFLNEERVLFKVRVDLAHGSTKLEGFVVFMMPHPYMGAQTAGSAMSYADKVFMRMLFKIPTGQGDADVFDARRSGRPPTKFERPPAPQGPAVRNQAPPPPPPPPARVIESNEARVARMVAEGEQRAEDIRTEQAERRAQERQNFEIHMNAAAKVAKSSDLLKAAWQRRGMELRRLEVAAGVLDPAEQAEARATYERIKQRFASRKAELLKTEPSPEPSRRLPPPFRRKPDDFDSAPSDRRSS